MMAEIYYFSGTGNSLYAAKELRKRIPDSRLIPILKLRDSEDIKSNGDVVGFVFPIHFMAAPSVVMDIIKKLDLQSAQYIFVIATRYGTPCNIMFEKIEKVLEKKGKTLNSYLAMNMASNDPKFQGWHPAAEDEITVIESEIQSKLDSFAKSIINQKDYQEADTSVLHPVSPVMERLGALAINITGDGKEDFYSDSKCNGCGICQMVCLSGKIRLVKGHPEWQKNKKCFSCYACINYCPQKSIQIKSGLIKFYTENNERYPHPYADAREIASQK